MGTVAAGLRTLFILMVAVACLIVVGWDEWQRQRAHERYELHLAKEAERHQSRDVPEEAIKGMEEAFTKVVPADAMTDVAGEPGNE